MITAVSCTYTASMVQKNWLRMPLSLWLIIEEQGNKRWEKDDVLRPEALFIPFIPKQLIRCLVFHVH